MKVKEDETKYLLKSKANRKQLLKAIEDVKKRKNLNILDVGELKKILK